MVEIGVMESAFSSLPAFAFAFCFCFRLLFLLFAFALCFLSPARARPWVYRSAAAVADDAAVVTHSSSLLLSLSSLLPWLSSLPASPLLLSQSLSMVRYGVVADVAVDSVGWLLRCHRLR